eukprot:GHVH01013131.1.p1 GENE.GHVH01013131.1~~GHVH01013131.1.p1  ORF type:complete len:976 (+),score=167.46 GHVH01013131.1:142-3069(+)
MSAPFDESNEVDRSTQPQYDGEEDRATFRAGNVHFDVSDDASEAEEVIDEFEAPEESEGEAEEGEDLFGEEMMADYRGLNDPDNVYETTLMDDTEQGGISEAARRRAEEVMSRREREREEEDPNRPGRRADQYYDMSFLRAGDEDQPEAAPGAEERVRKRRQQQEALKVKKSELCPSVEDFNLAYSELPYHTDELVWMEAFSGCIKVIFLHFLWTYHANTDQDYEAEGEQAPIGHYITQLTEVIREDKLSLHVEYGKIAEVYPKIGAWISSFPEQVFLVFNEAVNVLTRHLYKDLLKCSERFIKVRMSHFASFAESMNHFTTQSLNHLVACEGVVVRRSGMIPKIKNVYLQCTKCSAMAGPFTATDEMFTKTRGKGVKSVCHNCGEQATMFQCREKTTYETIQYLTIQELPAAVSMGRAPIQKEVQVDGDLVDLVRPGDDVLILAHYTTKKDYITNSRTGFPIVNTILAANNMIKRTDVKMAEITEDDKNDFRRLSKHPQLREKVIASICPSIWGHRHAKTGLAMAMFGGVRQEVAGQDKHSIRGDINVLLVGDPGMAKSQLLKYVNKTVEKSIYTTGKGASAAGLTASMKKDPVTGEYSLEGGALVLADTGICLIDEFDKMSELDRVSIHEAMEAQTISISKAGIVTSLRARCSVIAAANPIYGRYDSSLTFSENVTLGDTILSRFDVVAVMRDVPNSVYDTRMARHILANHLKDHPDVTREKILEEAADDGAEAKANEGDFISGEAAIPQHFLSKYLMYARKNIFPVINSNEKQKIVDFYAKVRQSAIRSGGLPLTVRHLESILRMSFANAKMRLSSHVSRADIDYSIATMLESFIQSQKGVVQMSLSKQFGRFRAMARNPFELVDSLLQELITEKSRERSRNHSAEDLLEHPDLSSYLEVSVSVHELAQIAATTHNLPSHLIDQFVSGSEFQKRYRVASTAARGQEIFARGSPVTEESSVNIDFVEPGTTAV